MEKFKLVWHQIEKKKKIYQEELFMATLNYFPFILVTSSHYKQVVVNSGFNIAK